MKTLLVALLLSQWSPTGIVVKDEGVGKGTAGTVNCTGAGITCSVGPGGVWTLDGAAGGGGGAPTTALYWTGAADAGLSAEKNLGALSTGLVLNTAGTPSAYAGSTCTSPNLVQTINGSGGVSCYQLKLNELANPAGDASWAFPSGTKLLYTFTGSTDVAFSIDGDGSFLGTGDLMHVHKSGTGSSFGADAVHVEVTTDTNMTGMRFTMPSANATAVNQIGSSYINGNVTSSRFYGPLTGNVTGSANTISPAGTSTQFWRGDNTWGTPAGTYSLPDATAAVTGGLRLTGDLGGSATSPTVPALSSRSGIGACGVNTWASTLNGAGAPTCTQPGFTNISGTATAAQIPTASTTLGGVKMAGACSAGNHVASIVAGELTCTADAGGGGGADALGRYLVQIATNAPANAQIMASLGTGLVKNTTTTGVQSIAASGTDYGPPTSANATGLIVSTTTTGAHTAYAGTSCTNQFPRSLNASGAATCAGVAVADLTATGTPSATTFYRGDNTWATPAGGAGVGTLTRLTATWTSSATGNTLGIVGAGGVPMTSPSYSASAPYSGECKILMTRPSTSNQPRYGIQSSGTVTTANTYANIGLAGTLPARTEAIQSTNALATASCAAGCTANVVTGGTARVFMDTIDIAGVMNASGTISLVMAPSASASHTAQIGSYCVWY